MTRSNSLALLCGVAAHLVAATSQGADLLAAQFLNPPDAAKPLIRWQWMNGCVTREGITADLESFKRAGIGGVQQFLIGGSEAEITDPAIRVLNPQWNELMKFSIAECARLGLSFGAHNCPGWTSSGVTGMKAEDSMQKLVWTATDVTGPGAFSTTIEAPKIDPKWQYYRDVTVLAVQAKGDIRLNQEIDLTDKLRPDGTLDWNAPAGDWTVYRVGHTTTGQVNGTGPESGQGLEADKMSRQALEHFWQIYPAKLIALAGMEAGKAFVRLEIDSYEAGDQNWTPLMLQEFRRRRGYDLRPWLPVLLGRTVVDAAQTARFRQDWKRTLDDLVAENYYGYATELTHRVPNMRMMIEPYQTGRAVPFSDGLTIGRTGDLLESEFWWGPTTWGWDSVKPVTSSTHTNGGTVSLAEALTGQPTFAWKVDPHDLRAAGDRAFALGVNQFILHAAAHQPWPTWKPGMTMGFWGTQFGPGQTWWEHGGPEWLRYLARTQFMLQQGQFVGDICWLSYSHNHLPGFPTGYDGDFIARGTLIERLSVKDGHLELPGGPTYRLLVLPRDESMEPELARKIEQLVKDGATVYGPRPTHAKGLQDAAAADAEVAAVGQRVWGDGDGKAVQSHAYGRGRVRWGMPIEQALTETAVEPDVQFSAPHPIVWLHRKVDEADIYFVSNQKDEPLTADVSFRVTGLVPELWHADTGNMERAPIWKQDGGRTTVSLHFRPSDSMFVVFRQPAEHVDPIVRVTGAADAELRSALDGATSLTAAHAGAYVVETASGLKQTVTVAPPPAALPLDGPWQLRFPPGLGAPAHMTLEKLTSWPDVAEPGVKYFSGTATYSKDFDVPASYFASDRLFTLDLGTVKNIAEVRINDQPVGTLWNPPFRTDVTAFLKPGPNRVEVRVTNLWPNRLIGDEQRPNDLDWGSDVLFLKHSVGKHLRTTPKWLNDPAQRTSGRITFTTFKFFNADSPLLESGLIGPVKVEVACRQAIRF